MQQTLLMLRHVFSLVALSGAALPSDLWIVDDAAGPGSDFTVLDDAIQAAADGDVILVRQGFYDPFTLDGKSLVIVADTGAQPAFNYTNVVRNIAAHQRVVLLGLVLGPTDVAFEVSNAAGAVFVSDCTIEAHDTFSNGWTDAMHVSGAARLTFVDCSVISPDQPFGGDGALVTNSAVAAWNCTFAGGFPDLPSTTGGAALRQSGGTLFASGCSFTGGTGGWGGDWGGPTCEPGGRGGAALQLDDVDAYLRDSTTIGGPGGSAQGSGCPDGAPGPAHEFDSASTITTSSAASRRTDLPGVLRPATPAALTLSGEPGDVALVFFGAALDAVPALDLAGVIALAPPWVHFATFVLDANGEASLPIHVPTLPAPLRAAVFQGQSVFASASDGIVLGAPFATVVLGPGV